MNTATTTGIRVLRREQLSAYLSPYLQGGYKEDSICLDFVEVLPDAIHGSFTVQSFYVPSDRHFHLTVPIAFICIAQLGIIAGCLNNHLDEKPQEIYLRNIALTCRRHVRKTSDLRFCLRLEQRRRIAGGLLYKGRVDVERGSFVGTASFVLPLAAEPR